MVQVGSVDEAAINMLESRVIERHCGGHKLEKAPS